MNRIMSAIARSGVVAGLAYLLDPDQGKRRRALIRDKAAKAMHNLDDGISKAGRDLRNRTRGVVAETLAALGEKEAPDWLLAERVRAKIGGLVRFPSLIDVLVHENRVILTGAVLADEVGPLLERAASVRGVTGVDNRLEVYQTPNEIPALQNQNVMPERHSASQQKNWSPSARLLTGLGGSSLFFYGWRRGGFLGKILGALGLGVAVRGFANRDMKQLLGWLQIIDGRRQGNGTW